MKTQASFVGAQGAVEFNPEAAVDMHMVLIICPGDTENNLPLRLAYPFYDFPVGKFGVFHQYRPKAFKYLPDCLMKFHLSGVSGYYFLKNGGYFFIYSIIHLCPFGFNR